MIVLLKLAILKHIQYVNFFLAYEFHDLKINLRVINKFLKVPFNISILTLAFIFRMKYIRRYFAGSC